MSDTSWQQPAVEQSGIARFVQTVRERALLIAVVTLGLVGLAVVYVVTADRVYEAQADLLVTPVPADSGTLSSLGLLTESADPTLDVQTAAQLVQTTAVAERVQKALDTDASPESLLRDVTVEPVGQSNVIAIVAQQPTAEQAANLANAFAVSTIKEQNAQLRDRIDRILPGLEAQQARLPAGELASQSLADQLAQLEALQAGGDPTLRVQDPAQVPDSPVWPRPLLTVILALIVGLGLGVGAAYGVQVLDPRLRREDQLRARYRLPILARVPIERRALDDLPLSWNRLSVGAIEAYRTLRATLTARGTKGEQATSFLVTGAGPSEGKTTTAINLAVALARSNASVLLIEADLRRPAIGKALGLSADRGVVSVMIDQAELADAVVPIEGIDGAERLSVLLADSSEPGIEEMFSLPAAERLIRMAERQFDYVVVDSPPLIAVVDALPLTRQVDGVLLVARFGKTRLGRLKELGELLGSNDVRPAGFVVVGAPREERGYYYHRSEGTGTKPKAKSAPQRTASKVSEKPRAAAPRRRA